MMNEYIDPAAAGHFFSQERFLVSFLKYVLYDGLDHASLGSSYRIPGSRN